MDSILASTKKLLGIYPDDTNFDLDILMHINTVFTILNQLGVGPDEGFTVTDANDQWTDFMSDNPKLNSVKSYVYLKVRLLFDPPLSSSVVEAINRSISELEWRMTLTTDGGD